MKWEPDQAHELTSDFKGCPTENYREARLKQEACGRIPGDPKGLRPGGRREGRESGKLEFHRWNHTVATAHLQALPVWG